MVAWLALRSLSCQLLHTTDGMSMPANSVMSCGHQEPFSGDGQVGCTLSFGDDVGSTGEKWYVH